ncbi:MFS transporter [Cytobacillus sp. FJAT-54145]|uniref:MFS transporter n=1 Tax=Cytobacillus spartinae TaxID=3299023 RepID=A0ABW6KFA8_9BACI
MKGSNHLNKRNSSLLLFGIGISSLGDFVYLVAINILVLKLTGSAAAVAGLWIMGPIASILTKFWSGSLVDRMNKRNLMIITDIVRAVIVAIIPFLSSIWLIYVCLFFLSVAKAFFEPTSITYITRLVPQQERKQFNSFRSLVTSGAFLVGPAIAGVLFLITTVDIAIWINAISFIVSAFLLMLLPNVDEQVPKADVKPLSIKVLREDWESVIQFSRKNLYIVQIFFLAQFFMIVSLGMDAQEVVFTQRVLGLSETDFGLLISITGIGSIVGASTVSIFAKKMSIKQLISLGFLMVAVGYLIYAFSFSFWSVAVGFIILGFFNSFSNTGFMTFYQNNVPTEMMGRISSVFGTFISLFQIIFVLLIGYTGEIIPLRYSVIIASFIIVVIGILITFMVNQPSRSKYFDE